VPDSGSRDVDAYIAAAPAKARPRLREVAAADHPRDRT